MIPEMSEQAQKKKKKVPSVKGRHVLSEGDIRYV